MSVLVTEDRRPNVLVHLKDPVGAKIHTNIPQNHTQVIQNVHGVLSIKCAGSGKGAFPANVVQLHMEVPKRGEKKVAMKLKKVDGKKKRRK